ncbi:MAG: FtsX-like permease family protein, partial [Mycobacteriales bacterium]
MPGPRLGHPARTAPPPSNRRGTILLPPWTRAPGLGFRNPAVLLAVIGAAAILACASSSAALFLSSSSSKALQTLVGGLCPDAAQPATTLTADASSVEGSSQLYPPGGVSPATYRTLDAGAADSMRAHGLGAPVRRFTSTFWKNRAGQPLTAAGTSDLNIPVSFYYGDRALAHVTKLASAGGRGVWISDVAASDLSVRAGGTVRVNGQPVRVAGTYRDLYKQPAGSYWCSQVALIHNLGLGDSYPPKLFIFTDAAQFVALDHRVPDNPSYEWASGADTHHISLSAARGQLAGTGAVVGAVRSRATQLRVPGAHVEQTGQLPALVDRSAAIRTGLSGPVVPIALAGSLLALLLVGAAGSYWADRRFREVRLLSSRGVGPVALAVKAAAELTAPALIGAALGWGLAIGLVRLLGPSSTLDRAAPGQAALTAAGAFVLGVLLLALVAGVRARNATERPVGHRRGQLSLVPWELLVLAGAAAMYLRLRDEQAVELVRGIARINLLVVAFPLVFLLGSTMLLVRLVAACLPALRRMSARWPIASYFALRRITGATVVSVTLLGAAAMPVAVLVYSGAMTLTSHTTVDTKARVYAGAPVSVTTSLDLRQTPAVDAVGSVVVRYQQVTMGPDRAELLAINPATFAASAFWNPRLAGTPLATLMQQIAARPSVGGRIPAIVVPGKHHVIRHSVTIGGTTRKLNVVSTPVAFPGLRDHFLDFVVVDARSLGAIEAGRQTELWSRAGEENAQQAIVEQGGFPLVTITPRTVIDGTNYVAISWTFGYLESLAGLVGLIAIGGL